MLAFRERDKGYFEEFFGNQIGEMYDNEIRVVLILPVEERDPDLLHGGQAGQYPAPLHEGEGHDGHVGIQTGKVRYPVVYDNVRRRYVLDRGRLVYQGAGHAIDADVREVGHEDHGISLQHYEGGQEREHPPRTSWKGRQDVNHADGGVPHTNNGAQSDTDRQV